LGASVDLEQNLPNCAKNRCVEWILGILGTEISAGTLFRALGNVEHAGFVNVILTGGWTMTEILDSINPAVADATAMLENNSCGVCGGVRFAHMLMARDYLYGNEGHWPVARCESCGVVLMHPRIPPEKIGGYYPKIYYAHSRGRGYRLLDSLRQAFKDAATERYYGYRIKHDAPWYGRLVGWLTLPLSKYHTYSMKGIYPVPNGVCLDIGAGNGQRLSEYRYLGWKTNGVEPSETAAGIARSAGHVIYNNIFEAAYPLQYFDAITLWDSLEHIPNPLEVMHEVHRILKPDGTIYISVPNYGSWYGRVLRDRWCMFTAPVHYYHYTTASLTNLLKSADFDVVSIRYPLGDVGFQQSFQSIMQDKPGLSRLLNHFVIRKVLAVIDYILPNGHMNVIARRSAVSGNQ
jgi:SAM-dependent methyltransferase